MSMGSAGFEMHEHELFPLDAVPSWVKLAILREFKGRTPAIREVARICDRSWLAVPRIGRTALACIRQATGNQHPLSVDRPAGSISDAELLTRLERLQEEFQDLNQVLMSKKVHRPRRVRKAP